MSQGANFKSSTISSLFWMSLGASAILCATMASVVALGALDLCKRIIRQ